MFAIDTNILIYAHNEDSEFNKQASEFMENVMNNRDESGNLFVCMLSQVLMEFVNVITRQNIDKPLSLLEAINVVHDYLETGIKVIGQRETQIHTFLDLLISVTTRKKVFDVALAATLKDNGISGLYTVNVDDFAEFAFLKIVNPLSNTKNT